MSKQAFKIKFTINMKPLKKFQKENPSFFRKALERSAIQFLTWCNAGSSKESRKPPIRWGVLRGSSSAFVGNKLVCIYPQQIAEGIITPARSHVAKETTLTFVWNTDYATKMHEWKGGWGKYTTQDGDAGNKWLEKHLQADKEILMNMIGLEFKRIAKT